MAIFSLSHNPVGRTTHAAGTAGAHARYVAREGAASLVLGEHMPTGREASRAWLNAQEAADRRNARMIDKVLLALPIELDAAERAQLVRDFAGEVGGGRIPWLAGIHDRGEDAHNPHAHVIFRDRDFETGKRAVGLSEKGSTEQLRETWERVANQALERAGLDIRIDRRSLEAQGIGRQAGIHIGPNVLAMEERGIRPESRPQEVDGRVIDWPRIDQGRTRLDRQAEIEAANENERERDREKGGKGRSDPMPAASTSPEETTRQEREAPATPEQAAMLAEALAAAARRQATRARQMEQAQDIQRRASARAQDAAGGVVAEDLPEAVQRPSYAVESRTQTPEQPQMTADRQQEGSRLRQAIDRARGRLEALGDRLEAAYDRFRDRMANRQIEPKPAHEMPPSQEGGQLRTLLNQYRRHPGQGRSGPER